MRVELPEGQWAEIAEIDDLRAADRKAVNKAIRVVADPDTNTPIFTGALEDDMRDALLTRIVRNWSLQLPPPSQDPSSLDKLTLGQADALSEAIKGHMAVIQGRNAPVRENPDPTGDSAS